MPTTYALLSTYPPTQCGLATFSAALLAHLPEPGDHAAVVRVLDEPMPGLADEVGVFTRFAGRRASACVRHVIAPVCHEFARRQINAARYTTRLWPPRDI